jgi:hypothetical protein
MKRDGKVRIMTLPFAPVGASGWTHAALAPIFARGFGVLVGPRRGRDAAMD